MNKETVNKYLEFVITKMKLLINEKKYHSNGNRIKYLFEKHDSDELIIVFSGFTRAGLSARYNYNRTLSKIKANKLFILDDFGFDKRGAYYLGRDMDFNIQKAVQSLINECQKNHKIKKTVYVGTSKGGYAALYFGLKEKDSTIIAGAPQYYLAKYLNNVVYRESCLKYIIGEHISDSKLRDLDNLLPDVVKKHRDKNSKIYLHFSNKEHTYDTHMKCLVEDLDKYNYEYYLDVKDYSEHTDVGTFFSRYLSETIKNQTVR